MPTVDPSPHAPVGVDKCFRSRQAPLEDKKRFFTEIRVIPNFGEEPITNVAPSLAKRRETPRPIPSPPPVTIATRPANRLIVELLIFWEKPNQA